MSSWWRNPKSSVVNDFQELWAEFDCLTAQVHSLFKSTAISWHETATVSDSVFSMRELWLTETCQAWNFLLCSFPTTRRDDSRVALLKPCPGLLAIWIETPRTWITLEWDYVQDDKQAFAAVSGTPKFHNFNYGWVFEINAANKPVLESLNHIYTSYHLQSHAAMEFDAYLSNQKSWILVPAHYANGIWCQILRSYLQMK